MKEEPDNEELERRAEIVSRTSAGIQAPHEAFYIHSILYSAGCSLRAFARYDTLNAVGVEYPDMMIAAVQEAIGHAGALSRYFWPPPPRKTKGTERPNFGLLVSDRGEKLRNAFQVTKASPLFDRNLRNVWEHFDEKLDQYLLGIIGGVFFPECIIAPIHHPDRLIRHYFKKLDPESESLILLDDIYFFGEIRAEVQRILRFCARSRETWLPVCGRSTSPNHSYGWIGAC